MYLSALQLDDKLNFDLHIRDIYKSAANQLNALTILKNFMYFKEKKILINSFLWLFYGQLQLLSYTLLPFILYCNFTQKD